MCRWMGTLVVPRGSMYKFFVRVEFSDEDWFSSFVYMVAADSLKVTMNPFLKSCGIEMRGC